jgi:hypothetical protein
MAKDKKKASALNDLLKTLRRLIICVVAAIGLFREMPYDILLTRLAILGACLYLVSGMTELLFQYLSFRAHAGFNATATQSGIDASRTSELTRVD